MMSQTGTQSRAIFRSRLHVRRAPLPWVKTQSSTSKRLSVSHRSSRSALNICQVLLQFAELLLVTRKMAGSSVGSRYVEPSAMLWAAECPIFFLIPAVEAYEQLRSYEVSIGGLIVE